MSMTNSREPRERSDRPRTGNHKTRGESAVLSQCHERDRRLRHDLRRRGKEGRRDFRFVADRAVSDALLLRRLVKVKEK
jgi:hypothetical protein